MSNEEPGYIRAQDMLAGGKWNEYTLTIKKIYPPNTVTSADKKLIKKPIIEFSDAEKRLIVNPTNQTLIAGALGSCKVAEWIGKKVTLYAALVADLDGVLGPSIRIRQKDGQVHMRIKPKHLGKDLTGQQQYKE